MKFALLALAMAGALLAGDGWKDGRPKNCFDKRGNFVPNANNHLGFPDTDCNPDRVPVGSVLRVPALDHPFVVKLANAQVIPYMLKQRYMPPFVAGDVAAQYDLTIKRESGPDESPTYRVNLVRLADEKVVATCPAYPAVGVDGCVTTIASAFVKRGIQPPRGPFCDRGCEVNGYLTSHGW